jgi:hypothetical protein
MSVVPAAADNLDLRRALEINVRLTASINRLPGGGVLIGSN